MLTFQKQCSQSVKMDAGFLKLPSKRKQFEAMEAAYLLAWQLMQFVSLVLP